MISKTTFVFPLKAAEHKNKAKKPATMPAIKEYIKKAAWVKKSIWW